VALPQQLSFLSSFLQPAGRHYHQEISPFYRTRSFVTVFTTARHLSVPKPRWSSPCLPSPIPRLVNPL
jgi:hypothetical protein